ncbi:MAG: DNA primase, partial [Actinomycetota bacterium]|nr:DNA primase [Actinomycetota bacterium]
MTVRIRNEDIALVRERSAIDEIVSEHLQLRRAGGGSLKGLCPFHDEKSPSFQVTPQRGLFYCFGCGAGGDVIRFVEQVEHLSFTESVERLATRAGIQLRYEDTGSGPGRPSAPAGQRGRLLEANKLAAAFYAEQLATPEALRAREFLTERGFDREVAEQFGCGFAPGSWDALTRVLREKGFAEAELALAGLAKQSSQGRLIDRFHRRLLWPIKDITGDVIGFGARKVFDEDNGPKYLNTPDSPLYKKSHVLYGIERAKGDIAKRHQAVVVEGYTDVMACHLAGIPTAIASCGTAFGIEHIGVLRRLLMDQDELRGEVIYTFDGDAAGQAAALKMFGEDQRFVAQTFVAIEPEGRDPCQLRQDRGDEAVRDLIARRVPLVAFVLRATVARYDLETAEGRVTALRRTAPMVAHIKDRGLRPEYARVLAGLLGMDVESVISEVRRAGKQGQGTNAGETRRDSSDRADNARPPPHGAAPSSSAAVNDVDEGGATAPARPTARRVSRPDDGTASMVEREALKSALQHPAVAGPVFDAVGPAAYTQEAYRLLRIAIADTGGAGTAPASGPAWADAVSACLDDPILISLVTQLCVEPLRAGSKDEADYIAAVLARLQHLAAVRE